MAESGNNGRKTALIVVDLQQGLLEASPAPYQAAEVLSVANRLLARARAAGVPVIFMQHDGSAQENVAPHSPGWQLHPKLEVTPHDMVIRKTTCDSFYGSSLEQMLRSRGITDLVVLGYATDFCIDSTVRAAASREFSVTVVEDGHTTNDNPCCGAALVRKHHNWAWTNCTVPKPVRVVPERDIQFW